MRCLLNFGEVNEPLSRAFWDGFDDEDDSDCHGLVQPDLQLNFHTKVDISTEQFNTLLVIEGSNITSFVKETLLIGALHLCDTPHQELSVYKVGANVIAVVQKNFEISGQLLEILYPFARASKNVVTLSISSKIEYKRENNEDVNEISFLRGINSKFNTIKELGAPNFISGVAAGISSWRDSENRSYESYIAYVDNNGLDELSTNPILDLLKNSGFHCASCYTPKVKNQSYLYM